jgi:hypothetical protein
MRKILLTLTLALSLAGCAQLTAVRTALDLGTASVANPVTPERLYQIEASVLLVFSGLNTWKRACVQGLIPEDCKRQIRTVQVYTLQIKPYLVQLRRFVKNNDQVNAGVVFNQLTDIIGIVKGQAAMAGQNLGG